MNIILQQIKQISVHFAPRYTIDCMHVTAKQFYIYRLEWGEINRVFLH